MILEYKEYFSKALIWPMIFLFIAIALLVILILADLGKINFTGNKVLANILVIIFSLTLITNSISTLQHGVFLIGENESNVSFLSGEITQIEDAFMSPRFYYEDSPSFAKTITIDNHKFYIYHIGDFKVGDSINVGYLPKSTFILVINLE